MCRPVLLRQTRSFESGHSDLSWCYELQLADTWANKTLTRLDNRGRHAIMTPKRASMIACAQVKTKAGNVHAGVRFLENREEWVLSRGDNAGGFLQLSPEKTKLQLWGEWHVSYPCLSSDKDAKEATRAIRIPNKHSFLALSVQELLRDSFYLMNI